MKKALAWLLVIAMTAAISIGGTLAYLTDTDEDVNVMTVGQVKIDQLEYERIDVESADDKAEVQEFHDNKPLYPAVTEDGFDYKPGDTYVDWEQIGKDGYTSKIWDPSKINNEVDKMVFVKNKGDWDAYVRTVFAFEAGSYTTLDEFNAKMHLNLNTTDFTWEWVEAPMKIGEGTYFVAVATYNKVLTPGALTEISLSQIALDKTATNDDVAGFGDTYQILVQSQAVQAAGFDDPDTALNGAFGEIPPAPFEDDDPVNGIDLRTALHYLDGKKTGTKITSKVTNVVFALNSQHPDIVNNYEGTLVDVEQDVPVYAYYVPNGGNYDVYFLASDDIYLPSNSKELFMAMSALTTVDTSNLNTSRAVDMTDTFYNCTKLQQIDVSHWNLSNVEQMYGTFCECRVLGELDVSGWDVSNVVNMRALFSGCRAIESFDVSNWDTSKVTNMRNLFNSCYATEQIKGIGNWDTSSVTDMEQAFAVCRSLTELDIGSWDVSNVEDMSHTFRGCEALTGLDIGGWDTGKVKEFNAIFQSNNSNTGAMKLSNLDLSGWDTSSATNMGYMFYGCGQLTELDLSNWDVSNVTTMSHMFADCFALENVDFSNWQTDSLTNMDGLLNSCKALKSVDVSDFDTQNVTAFSQVFDGCSALEEIIGLNEWDTSSGVQFGEFLLGTNVVSIDLSSFDMSSAKYVTNMFHVNPRLTTIYVGDNWNLNPENLSSPNGMFGSSVALKGGNGSTVSSLGSNSAIYARVDTPETPGLLTHISDKPVSE